jgi:hypothetical protein
MLTWPLGNSAARGQKPLHLAHACDQIRVPPSFERVRMPWPLPTLPDALPQTQLEVIMIPAVYIVWRFLFVRFLLSSSLDRSEFFLFSFGAPYCRGCRCNESCLLAYQTRHSDYSMSSLHAQSALLSGLGDSAVLNWALSTLVFPVSPEFSPRSQNADVDAASPSYSLLE